MSTGGGPTKTTVEANVEAKLVEHPTVVEHPTIIAGDPTASQTGRWIKPLLDIAYGNSDPCA